MAVMIARNVIIERQESVARMFVLLSPSSIIWWHLYYPRLLSMFGVQISGTRPQMEHGHKVNISIFRYKEFISLCKHINTARQSSVHILICHFLCDFVSAVREASWRPVMRHRLSHCHDKNVTPVNLQTLETSAQWSRGERNSWLIRPSLWAAWQHWDHQVIRRHEWQHCSLFAPKTTGDQEIITC